MQLTQQQIQEQAEKLYPVPDRTGHDEYTKCQLREYMQDAFTAGAQWMQERENLRLAELINYIENDAEIAIPINELMNERGNVSKKEYGLVLLKHLVIELRTKFLPSPPKD